MSLYVARSSYRTSGRPGLLNFSRLREFFKKRDRRIDRSSVSFSLNGFGRFRRRRAFSTRTSRPQGFAMMNGQTYTHRNSLAGGLKGMEIFRTKASETFKKVKEVKIRHVFGPSAVMISLAVFAVGISLLYLAHFNQVATKGYDLRRLQADQDQLMSQYEIKNMRLAQITSLNTIAHSDRASVMRRPADVMFVRENTALASR